VLKPGTGSPAVSIRAGSQIRPEYLTDRLGAHLEFVKAQLARLPTRRDQAFTPLLIVVLTAFGTAALVILWLSRSGGIASEAAGLSTFWRPV
jgi:uncharacterized membrane protein